VHTVPNTDQLQPTQKPRAHSLAPGACLKPQTSSSCEPQESSSSGAARAHRVRDVGQGQAGLRIAQRSLQGLKRRPAARQRLRAQLRARRCADDSAQGLSQPEYRGHLGALQEHERRPWRC